MQFSLRISSTAKLNHRTSRSCCGYAGASVRDRTQRSGGNRRPQLHAEARDISDEVPMCHDPAHRSRRSQSRRNPLFASLWCGMAVQRKGRPTRSIKPWYVWSTSPIYHPTNGLCGTIAAGGYSGEDQSAWTVDHDVAVGVL